MLSRNADRLRTSPRFPISHNCGTGDASKSAFAAVIYARQPTVWHTSAQQNFVFGKTRVSPIKQKSIPKLELEAAVLGVRLLRIVRNAFSCSFPVVKFWTDSCVVLDWIQRKNKLKSFVAHRVNEITLHSDPLDWKYVPTKQNSADHGDHGTRGLRPGEIPAKWIEGPSFLDESAENWPKRPQTTCTAIVIDQKSVLFGTQRFSTWSNLVKVAAIVFRFVRRLRLPTSPSTLITFAKPIMRLSNNRNLCRLPLLFFSCVEIWIRPRATNSYLSDRSSIMIHSCALMAASYTHRSLKQFVLLYYSTRGPHNKTLPEARS